MDDVEKWLLFPPSWWRICHSTGQAMTIVFLSIFCITRSCSSVLDDILAPSCSGINHVTFRKEFSEIEAVFRFIFSILYHWLLPAQNVLHLYSVGVQLLGCSSKQGEDSNPHGTRFLGNLTDKSTFKSTLKRAIIETLNRRFFYGISGTNHYCSKHHRA